ncbi:hypothetical protein IM40_08550 [Candidatus Paracaedimonas acanthamoebae]|nr:hypothetical protein IM40_08550 [Candidatus Paracaedimonas acanthamoebae]
MYNILPFISYSLILILFSFSSLQASKHHLEEEAEQEEVFLQPKQKRSHPNELAPFFKPEKENTRHGEEEILEFVDRSVLLHLTPIFPENGIMRAGAMINNKPIPSNQAMPSRSTIHFSWNQFSNYSTLDSQFLQRPYCIIERLGAVQDQLYGGNPYDVMVVGDWILSKDSSIIVPSSQYDEIKQNNPRFKGKLITYNDELAFHEKVDQISAILQDRQAPREQKFSKIKAIIDGPQAKEQRLQTLAQLVESPCSGQSNRHTIEALARPHGAAEAYNKINQAIAILNDPQISKEQKYLELKALFVSPQAEEERNQTIFNLIDSPFSLLTIKYILNFSESAMLKANEAMKLIYKVPEVKLIGHPLHPSRWKIRFSYTENFSDLTNTGEIFSQDAKELLKPFFHNKYWGIHSDAPLGIVDTLLNYLNRPFVFMCSENDAYKVLAPHSLSLEEMEKSYVLFQYYYPQLLDRQDYFTEKMRPTLMRQHAELEGWLNLIKKELMLRREGYSIYKDVLLCEKFIRHRHEEDLIAQLCEENKERMKYIKLEEQEYEKKLKALKEEKPEPILHRIVAATTYENFLKMKSELEGRLYIEKETLELIKNLFKVSESWGIIG